MSCLYPFAAVLWLAISAGAEPLPAEDDQESRWEAPLERPGLPPVMVPVSEEILAREQLKGTWQVLSLEHEGRPRPDLAGGLRMEFSRGRIVLMQRGRDPIEVAYRPIPDVTPGHFTWVLHRDGGVDMQRGVYWQEGDALLLCLGPINLRRATHFLTQPGDGRTLFVLRRIKL